MNSQDQTPLLTALQTSSQRKNAPFYAPGHKRGQGIAPELAEVFGSAVFRVDLPELPELDNLFVPEGVIQKAQWLAAEAFGADQTWFLANGSTCGIQAAVLAVCQPGDKLILSRNSHQSAIAALILSGAIPVFVQPDYDPDWDLAHGLTPAGVAAALKQHPDAKAVMLLSPTYHGVCADVGAIAQLAHQSGIPLIVDEAHGAHFGFHPALPPSALSAGADVVIQSTHKVLGAMTQASMLHCRGDRILPERLSQAARLVQSTSPSYLLLASLDAARYQMATRGKTLMQHTLALATQARTQISQIPGLRVLSADQAGTRPGFATLDLTRLTVDVTGLGLTGFAADEIFHERLYITAELPTLRHLTFILSLGNTETDIATLVTGFRQLAAQQHRSDCPHPVPTSHSTPDWTTETVLPLSPLSPRDAFFAPTEWVPFEQAGDRLSAELICPYPPGIPILLPGDRIPSAALEELRMIQQQGGVITGCSDRTLQRLKVIA